MLMHVITCHYMHVMACNAKVITTITSITWPLHASRLQAITWSLHAITCM